MKKIILTVLLTLLMGFTAFADTLSFPITADMDLAEADEASMETFSSLVKEGYRMFDTAGLVPAGEQDEFQQRLQNLKTAFGQDAAIITVNGHKYDGDFDAYCDMLYYRGGFGTGNDRDGSILVVDLGTRDIRIYAQGGARRYFTDNAIDQIFDSYNGGIVEPLSEGDYYGAFYRYIEAVDDLYKQGVQQDQYNYDPTTGEKDPYYKQNKPFLRLWQVIVSLVISLLTGFGPVNTIKRQYAMETEKRAAQSVSKAYRAAAAFAYDPQLSGSRMIGKSTRSVIIPRSQETRGPQSGNTFGGGQSTGHASMGGGQHTSGGRKF